MKGRILEKDNYEKDRPGNDDSGKEIWKWKI